MTLHAKMAMPNSQWYPWHLSLINNVEDIVGFPSIKVLNSNNSFIIFCIRNAPVTTSFSNLNLEIKFMLYQTMLLKVSLWIGHCHLCMESHLKLHSQSLLRNCTLTKKHLQYFFSLSENCINFSIDGCLHT